MNLTEEQKKIINHPTGQHGRVLAGPGTGKSFTAVALVKKLYEDIGVGGQPLKIKFLTFTRAATAELARKLGTTAIPVENPNTLHSFSLGVLLQNSGCVYFPLPLRIPSDFELDKLIIQDLSRRLKLKKKIVEKLINWMSAKWESLTDGTNIDIPERIKSQFTDLFEIHRKIFGYTLIQEIPDLLRQALHKNSILSGIDYEFIIIDEYQDLNACDLAVIKQLASRGIHILAIGDDDQSIYSGRNAEPAGIRNFLSDFSTDKDYRLTICHRCGKKILKWAQSVIAGDDTREIPKTLRHADTAPDGIANLLRFRSNESEAKGVATIIKWLHDIRGVSYPEILVLSRTDFRGAFSTPVKQILERESIPVSSSNLGEILNKIEVVRMLSFLRLIENQNDSLAWWNLLSQTNNIGPTLIDSIYQKAKQRDINFGSTFRDLILSGSNDLSSRGRKEANQLLGEVDNFLQQISLPEEGLTSWGEWITELINSNLLPDCGIDFKKLLKKIDDVIEHNIPLGRFLSQIPPLGRDIANSEKEGVRFMSIAGSKGLTVKGTIVLGVDDDLIPRKDADLSEEHRLLYVAMTRPTDYLFLTWSGQRRGLTARSGRTNVLGQRRFSRFLEHGLIKSESGEDFITSLQNR
ncbi:ATP-dependent helicase [Patescibacteria group bacterium AH-259-L07]|nr:ATP-dependent helicase [Patescibacteria group bacterium AH-259-L07]